MADSKAKTIKVNIYSLANKKMHYPVTSGDQIPLYPHVDASNSSEGGSELRKYEQSDDFQKASKIAYNSPTNIRRLFIAANGVTVHYYCPYIKGATSLKEAVPAHYLSTRAYDKIDGESVENLLLESASYKLRMAKIQEAKAQGYMGNIPEPRKVTVDQSSSSLLSLASNVFTLNNLEELYIDWILFLNPQVQAILTQMFGGVPTSSGVIEVEKFCATVANNITMMKRGQPNSLPGDLSKNNMLAQLFMSANGIPSNDMARLQKKFPRLKVLGMISNLTRMDSYRVYEKATPGEFALLSSAKPANPNENCKPWYLRHLDEIQQSGSICIISEFPYSFKYPASNEFIVKDTEYIFDRNILSDRVKKYKNDVLNSRLKAVTSQNKSESESANEDEKSLADNGLEQRIAKLYVDENEKKADVIIKLASFYISKSEKELLKEELVEFTPPNRNKIAKLTGIDLGVK